MNRTALFPAPEQASRYAPSVRGRWLAFAAVVSLHLAALWLSLSFVESEVLRARAVGNGSSLRVFTLDAPAEMTARRSKAGMPGGADAAPLSIGDAATTKAARGKPDAVDREDIAGDSSTLSKAIADALADNPGAAGERLNYRAQLIAHIRRFLFYPPEAMARGLSGTVLVRFRIDRSGQVIDLRIISTRGAVLDAAAMGTIWRAEPMPTVPIAIATPWEVDVPIDFHASIRRGR